MPRAAANGIEIEYETFGEPDDPALLLVSGLGGQLLSWDAELCLALVDRGFYVVRFDNRDVGLSTKIDWDGDVMEAVMAAMSGHPVQAPYLLAEMADDAWGLLDALDVRRAHLVGMSMGGMIVQTMAIARQERVLTLTSIMSTTGDPDVGRPDPEVMPILFEKAPDEREAFVEFQTEGSRMIGSPDHFDAQRVRARHAACFDRCYCPAGVGRQLVAIMASGSRSDGLRALDVPALVIHGEADRLVEPSGGERTAECLRGSQLLLLEGMGHDLPTYYWPPIVEAITALASRAADA